MSRRAEGQLFVGRLSKRTTARDLEDVFEAYGHMTRCEVKYGAEMAYAFVDFDDRRDAEDAIKYENGRDIIGSSIIVEFAKGSSRRSSAMNRGYDECYRCHRSGHWARDCPEDRYSGGFRRQSRGSGRYRSPSPRRRRRRSRSGSRDRRRRKSRSRSRSRSHSRDQRRRSRSQSGDRKRSSRRRSHSRSKSKSHSRSKSRSGSPASKSRSRSKSASAEPVNGDNRAGSASRSRSRSRSASD